MSGWRNFSGSFGVEFRYFFRHVPIAGPNPKTLFAPNFRVAADQIWCWSHLDISRFDTILPRSLRTRIPNFPIPIWGGARWACRCLLLWISCHTRDPIRRSSVANRAPGGRRWDPRDVIWFFVAKRWHFRRTQAAAWCDAGDAYFWGNKVIGELLRSTQVGGCCPALAS